MDQKPFVELWDVSLVYGRGTESVPAIEQLTLSIGQGDFVAVVGPSGCGKSSLMKLVTGLLLPTGGTIFVGGNRVTSRSSAWPFRIPLSCRGARRCQISCCRLTIVKPHKRRLRANKKEYVMQAEQLLAAVGLGGSSARNFPGSCRGGCSSALIFVVL